MELPASAVALAVDNDFEIKGYRISAQTEQIRKPRIVRVGAVQNSIVLPTTAPVDKQREAIWNKIRLIIKTAAAAEVNIICMQEAWSKLQKKNVYINEHYTELLFSSIPSNAICLLHT